MLLQPAAAAAVVVVALCHDSKSEFVLGERELKRRRNAEEKRRNYSAGPLRAANSPMAWPWWRWEEEEEECYCYLLLFKTIAATAPEPERKKERGAGE